MTGWPQGRLEDPAEGPGYGYMTPIKIHKITTRRSTWPIKKYKPTTPGRRGMTVTDYSVLSKVDPARSLLESKKQHAGRTTTGKITVRHHGGGNRVKYRVIDFKRNKFEVPATVKTLEYDPNRSAFIALVEYEDGAKSYILAPDGLKVGDTIMAGPNADIKPGNALPFENIPVGTMIHYIELYPG